MNIQSLQSDNSEESYQSDTHGENAKNRKTGTFVKKKLSFIQQNIENIGNIKPNTKTKFIKVLNIKENGENVS